MTASPRAPDSRSTLSVGGALRELLSPAFSSHVSKLSKIGRTDASSSDFLAQLQLDQLPLLPEDLDASAAANLLEPLWDARNSGSWGDWFRYLPRPIKNNLSYTAAIELLCVGTMIGSPLLLKKVLDSLADQSDSAWSSAFLWIVALVVLQTLAAIFTNVRDALMKANAQRIAAGLHQAIFVKYLRLGSEAKMVFAPGAVLNLTSTDVKYITNFLQKFHDLWSPAVQVLLIFGVLYSLISWAVFVGLAALGILFAVQSRATGSCSDGIRGYVDTNDRRVGYVREILYGISAVKLQTLEAYFLKRVGAVRVKQLGLLKKYLVPTFCYFAAINQAIPGVTALVSYGAYTLAGNTLEASRVFAALTLFNLIYTPAFKLTLVANRVINIIPSLKRVRSYMTQPELTIMQHSHSDAPLVGLSKELPALALEITDNVFTWAEATSEAEIKVTKTESSPPSGFRLTMRNIAIPRGSLVLMIGPNGSGKSSFFSALLGEMQQLHAFALSGSVAYCPQEPWIQTGTVRSNVLMHLPLKESAFATAVATTFLKHDLTQLPKGDMTSVGEKGANFSGGQKMRIALARAVYSDADVILLDDVLAPLDTIVANNVFTDCILGELAQKTVFLTTQRLQFLHAADVILFVSSDGVVSQGSLQELRTNESFKEFVENFADDEETDTANSETATMVETASVPSDKAADEARASIESQEDGDNDEIIEEEERSVGQVAAHVYKAYIRHAGGKAFLILLFFSVAVTLAAQTLIGVWLAWWSAEKFGNSVSQLGYLGIYALLTMLQIILAGYLSYVMVAKSLQASESMHSAVLGALLQAPVSFFQSQPIGRVLSRFNRDIQVVDADLMNAIDGLVTSAGAIGGSLLTIFASSPILIVLFVPILALSYWGQRGYKHVALHLRRLLAILASPVSAFFSETLAGASTVRAYGLQEAFKRTNASHINGQTRGEMYRIFLDSWIVMRLQIIFAPFTLLIGVLAASRVMSASFAGLALSMAITSTANVYLFLWAIVTLEVNMNSVERLCHYIDEVPPESPPAVAMDPRDLTTVLATWPEKGQIEFQQVVVTFEKRQEPVLKAIDLSIQAGERVGIVGRTGMKKATSGARGKRI
ncbi:hypothetical protein HDU86_006835 [Geranomyces michiganensis]|nr:hypothetical protein HDU86_006835 [Geranomyces michiganensis]